ncbi:MAG: class I SAM-dependent methyltransferase [bacterium]
MTEAARGSTRPAETRKNWIIPPARRGRLVSAHRRRRMPPAKTLRAFGLERGKTLLDVGCGPGYFSIPACRIVGPAGAVLACDISPIMLRDARRGAKEAGAANLRLRRCKDPEIPFPDASADLALLAFVVHETASVEGILAETRRVLRPGGRAAFLEWHPRETEQGPPVGARLGKSDLTLRLGEAGFAVSRSGSLNPETYFLLARPKAARRARP